jgi:hypothetical protein
MMTSEGQFTITQVVDEAGLNEHGRRGWRLRETIIVEEVARVLERCLNTRQYGDGYLCACSQCVAFLASPGAVVKRARFVVEGPGSEAVSELEKLLEGLKVEKSKLEAEIAKRDQDWATLGKAQKASSERAADLERRLEERVKAETQLQASVRKYETDMGKLRKELGEARMREILG